jgi:lipopolysaccharide transport system permease protein
MSSTIQEAPARPAQVPHLRIRPSTRWAALNLREVWQFRDLLMTLAARDVKLRYRQTALGAAWVILQPLLAAGIFSFVFNRIAGLKTGTIPPFVFTFASMLAWSIFSTTLTKSSMSLVGNANLVSKVFFPRLVLPLSTVFSTLLDFVVASVLMIILMVMYHIVPSWSVVLLPVWLLLFLMLSLGIGLIAAAANVQYRDIGYILPVVVQFLQYASPVAYATDVVVRKLGHWSFLYFLNPLAPLLEAFRWSLFGRGAVHWPYLAYAAVLSILVFLAGAFQFKKMERKFADVI